MRHQGEMCRPNYSDLRLMLQLLYFIAVSKKIIEQESVVVRRNGEYCVYFSLIPNTITITKISLQLYCDIIFGPLQNITVWSTDQFRAY